MTIAKSRHFPPLKKKEKKSEELVSSWGRNKGLERNVEVFSD